MTMTAEFNAGGCERCGNHEHVTYHHWQFLCAECREILADEQARDHDRAVLVAGALSHGTTPEQAGVSRTG
jgi:predicted alpha/beta-fold hydrolase